MIAVVAPKKKDNTKASDAAELTVFLSSSVLFPSQTTLSHPHPRRLSSAQPIECPIPVAYAYDKASVDFGRRRFWISHPSWRTPVVGRAGVDRLDLVFHGDDGVRIGIL